MSVLSSASTLLTKTFDTATCLVSSVHNIAQAAEGYTSITKNHAAYLVQENEIVYKHRLAQLEQRAAIITDAEDDMFGFTRETK